MNGGAEVLVIYDKQCPACDYYCNMVRIRESVGRLVLVDARDGGPVMDEITARGLDIDQGMVVKVAQFIGDCSSSKWSKHVTNSPFLARRATVGSSAAYKIISACSNAVS
jgi:hypothetical protein